MSNMSSMRVGGVSMMVGAFMAVIMIILRPGHLAIDLLLVDATLLDRVKVLAENSTLTHISALLVALGMLLMLFGFFSMRRALDGEVTARAAFVRLAVVFLTFGITTLAIANGLNHMIDQVINQGIERGRPLQTLYTLAVDIQAVKAGIALIGGYGYLVGMGLLALGMYLRFRAPIHRVLSAAAILVSVAALVLVIIGDHADISASLYRIATYGNIPLMLWSLVLGYLLYTEHRSLKPQES